MKERSLLTRTAGAAFLVVLATMLVGAGTCVAQEAREEDAATALSAALSAACRGNSAQFANYLTAENSSAFLALPDDQQKDLMKRFSLTERAGKPLMSSDQQNHIDLRCEAPAGTAEFRFGEARVNENLAFIRVTVVNSESTQFGLVRERGAWRLLSLGLVLLNVPELSKQWHEQELAGREDTALDILHQLADAVHTYRRAFGRLPESLGELGPAPKDQISPEQANLINEDLASTGIMEGYQFRYRIVPAANDADAEFELAATPQEYGVSGRRSFFMDAAGKVHGADKHGSVAVPTDQLLDAGKTQ
jgi:hypothetical protein